ncbi:MAG: hypothetical protein ACTHMP_10145, partial [Thermomicrobiales bacterium]
APARCAQAAPAMSFQPLPDWKGALISRLRSLSDVTALCPASRIVGTLPGAVVGKDAEAKAMPTYAIAVVKVPGGFGAEPTLPLRRPRLDLFCYGANPLAAMNLWRTVQAALEPPTRQGIAFTVAGCRVLDITCVADPAEAVDPETNWPFVQASYVLLVNEVAVA